MYSHNNWYKKQGQTITTYHYDNNGSLVYKIYGDVLNDIQDMTSDQVQGYLNAHTIAYDHHVYNLQNRLARVEKYDSTPALIEAVEYRYDTAGIRIQKTEDFGSTPIVTDYLIDPYNHTGYAQVLQETTDSTVTYYTIGDDVLAQTTGGVTDYLLYDGHGSTRQLVDNTGTVVNAGTAQEQSFSYDAYGVMLSDGSGATAAASANTSLLYSGEQYDSNLDQYYLRARYYNQNNGTFNRVDPYSGNTQDPQSLHKYAYVHNNPVNNIDPTGKMSLIGVTISTAIACALFMGVENVLDRDPTTTFWGGAKSGFIWGAGIALLLSMLPAIFIKIALVASVALLSYGVGQALKQKNVPLALWRLLAVASIIFLASKTGTKMAFFSI